VEFGLCKQNGMLRAYGAGLLSSFGELEHCLTDTPEKRPLNVAEASTKDYIITTYQMMYYVADSFDKAREQFTSFMHSMDRPYSVRYNPYNETVEVLDSEEKLLELAEDIQYNSELLTQALRNNHKVNLKKSLTN